MKKILCLVILSATFFACKDDPKKDKKFDTVSYEKAKETLAEKEKNNPVKFIQVDNRDRKNLIGQTVVIGHLTNNAKLCTYKDVDLKLSFFSKTGVKLDEGIETIYETIAPGKTIKFKTKYFTPKGTDSVFVAVVKATGEAPEGK
ncbi:hypothetical protein GWC95_17485 [Sediminibacterium roseum]|uniref:Lipoprotein n=1 Tax=Sediminibacterium roseum TaxID=1978412 RepID=A0ABW9ZX32_9BACT|nr:hypothetical protein [Sediminibacterium roseum]NCI51721.1 hypothetical protein [Sediminibacterium roseum]